MDETNLLTSVNQQVSAQVLVGYLALNFIEFRSYGSFLLFKFKNANILLGVVGGVLQRKTQQVRRQFRDLKDGVLLTGGHAGTAADASPGVDKELPHGSETSLHSRGMNSVAPAYGNAAQILGASVGDHGVPAHVERSAILRTISGLKSRSAARTPLELASYVPKSEVRRPGNRM